MDIKSNDSTELRPEGDRVIDAPLVMMNLPEFIIQLKSEDTWKNSDRNSITIYKTNGLRIVLLALHEGAELIKHTAAGHISVQVLEGEIKFNTENESVQLITGNMIALHKGLPHSVQAIKESVFLLTLTTSLDK